MQGGWNVIDTVQKHMQIHLSKMNAEDECKDF